MEENRDEYFMRQALFEAKEAYDRDEIPVGVVIVYKDRIIARGKYLIGCTVYVTLEPCIMCAGALGWSQISRIVYGAADDKRGFQKFAPKALHPKTEIQGGVLQEDCARLMQDFFRNKR